MEKKEFDEIFVKELNKLELKANDKQLEKLYQYMKELIEWNEKINVTAITDEKMFIVKHLIDSLTINKYLEGKNKIIDVGTGGGFPGIPLKIMNEEKEIWLVDSVNKKLNVIRNITGKMNVKKLNIVHARAEEIGQNKEYREKFDVATSRAVSNFSTLVEYLLPLLKIGGIAICMKGPNYEEELKEAKKAIEVLGGKIEKIEKIILEDENERNIIIIKKEKSTPSKYPRGQSKPLKEPIK